MLELDVKLSLDDFDLSAVLALDSPLTALFGPQGSGKSTLLGLLAGHVNPQRGWIKFGGETLVDTRRGIRVPASRRRIGLVNLQPAIYSRGLVIANLRAAQFQAAVPVSPARFDEVVHVLELEALVDAHTDELSPAEKQRLAMAQALMASPRLLLLDEPPASDDGSDAAGMLAYVTRVQEELNLPVIYVSQSLNDIVRLTDQMVLMANGRILGVGDVHAVVADKLLLAASTLQGIDNVLSVTVLAHEAEYGCTRAYYYGTELILPVASHLLKGTTTQVAVRSSDIALSTQYLGSTSIQNQIKGRICAIIRTPGHAVVQVDCGNTLLAGISLRALHEMQLQEGDNVYCLIKAHAFSYLGEETSDTPFSVAPSTMTH